MYKCLIEILKHKSNIDYHYYHIFWNNVLDINFSQNNFTINYIVYIIDSDFSLFEEFFSKNHEKIFSDIFFERLMLTQENKQKLFQMIFKKLFWMRLNHINFFESVQKIAYQHSIYKSPYLNAKICKVLKEVAFQ